MKTKGKRLRTVAALAVFFLAALGAAMPAKAETRLNLIAGSALLVEEESGKFLYDFNADSRMYPASMTKILTALVALDYLRVDDVIVVGEEILTVPYDSSVAGHILGEHITVMNLLRGLMIPSGNETGVVLALNVAKIVTGDANISYAEAERVFCGLMNDKAKELGARDSNFVNPHGYYDPAHYTTAADMTVFARELMKNPILRLIVGEKEYNGNGMGTGTEADYSFITKDYIWKSHNELLLAGVNGYAYATGIKTGYTEEAGYCLTASAEKNGVKLVAVVMSSTEEGRCADAKALFEYGFENYHYETIQKPNELIATLEIENPMLGAAAEMNVLTTSQFDGFYSKAETERMTSAVSYDGKFVKDGKVVPPITKGQVVGAITFALDGETVFTGDLAVDADAGERTFNTDADYYWGQFKANIFSLKAAPYWACLLLVIILLTVLVVSLKRRKRNSSYYRLSKRY